MNIIYSNIVYKTFYMYKVGSNLLYGKKQALEAFIKRYDLLYV